MATKLQKILCVYIGHSHIYEGCFGYMHCARCGELLGDTLAGSYSDSQAVVVDHNCEKCFENYKKLTWKDKLLVPYPFEKKDGEYRVITKEERRAEMDKAMASMKKHSETRKLRLAEADGLWDRLPAEVTEWVSDDLLGQAFESDLCLDDFLKNAYQKTLV